MTLEEIITELKYHADKMYTAAQYMTTDASQLHKAMKDYRNFIVTYVYGWRKKEELRE